MIGYKTIGLILAITWLVTACGGASTPAPIPTNTATPQPVAETPTAQSGSSAAASVAVGELRPPVVATPCAPDQCPYQDQTVTVLMATWGGANSPISGPLYEVRDEFEAATGAKLEFVEIPFDEVFPALVSDLSTGSGEYDAAIAGAWWLGDLVAQDFLLPYNDFYNNPDFPEWDIEDVQPGPRSLLGYGDNLYMVANDHDGQVLYYRRDLLENPKHQADFEAAYGYPLDVPVTWDQYRDIAEYFDGKDLNGDGEPDDGLTMHLKAGLQGMFHFMSFSAPFVIGPENPNLYWFDPETMQPLIDSPGHVKALEAMVDLVQFGPEEMLDWDLGQSWDHFLAGKAALSFTWGDLGALAQQEGSTVKGKIGTAPMPGTLEYYNIATGEWVQTEEPNLVGNTTGGSWSGVISRDSDAPEATYYLLALLANKDKSRVYAARGWDGADPGRFSHYLPPDGTANLDDYLAAGWDQTDVEQYTHAYFENFSNEQQFPYLRIPGSFGYWTALDIHLFEAAKQEITPAEALQETALDFEELTIRLDREAQKEAYRQSLGIE